MIKKSYSFIGVFLTLLLTEATLVADPLQKGDVIFWQQNFQSSQGMKQADYKGRYAIANGQYLVDFLWNSYPDSFFEINHVSIFSGDQTVIDTGTGEEDGEIRILSVNHPDIKMEGDARRYLVYRLTQDLEWIAQRAVDIARVYYEDNRASRLKKGLGCARVGFVHLFYGGQYVFPNTHEKIKTYYKNYIDFLRSRGSRLDRNFFCSEFIARILQLAAIDHYLIQRKQFTVEMLNDSNQIILEKDIDEAIDNIAPFYYDPIYVKPSDLFRLIRSMSQNGRSTQIEYSY